MQIFIIIVSILIILLLIGITICVNIEEETSITIKYGFLKFNINLNEKEEEVQSFRHELKEKFWGFLKEMKDKFLKFINYTPKEKTSTNKNRTPSQKKGKKSNFKGIIEKIKEILIYVKPILNEIKISTPKLIKCFKIRNVKVKMFVASEDAHQTAIQFAKTSTVVSNAVSLLQIYSDIQIKKIEINADFLSEKSVNDIYFEVKFRLLFVIGNLLRLLFRIIVALVKVNLDNNSNIRKGA